MDRISFPTKDFKYIEQDIALKDYTTFKIGGNCDILIHASSVDEINHALTLAKELGVKIFVLGNGSNILAADEGFNGIVLHLGKYFGQVWCEGESVFAYAGASVKSVFECALKHKLSGAEFFSTIPATVGGAVYMNAGCFGADTAGVLKSVWATDGKNEIKFERGEMEFGYRKSPFQTNGLVVTKAEFGLSGCNEGFIINLSRELAAVKKTSQPLEFPSAGSIFKSPEGAYAGQLIDLAGLKGLQVGGACVSQKHAGFIVNKKNATADDVLTLIEIVKNKVKAKFGITLETEIQVLGGSDDTGRLSHPHEIQPR